MEYEKKLILKQEKSQVNIKKNPVISHNIKCLILMSRKRALIRLLYEKVTWIKS